MDKLIDVLTKWQNDLQFREEWKKNAAEALKKADMHLDEEDFQKVQSLLNNKEILMHELLEKKINK